MILWYCGAHPTIGGACVVPRLTSHIQAQALHHPLVVQGMSRLCEHGSVYYLLGAGLALEVGLGPKRSVVVVLLAIWARVCLPSS